MMCGIAGKLVWRPAAPDLTGGASHPGSDEAMLAGTLMPMLAAIVHRGPDSQDIHVEAGPRSAVGLAHARLSIIDLSERGRQPMALKDGSVVLVYNGEIYNFRELARELETLGHRFTSRTDTEVLLLGYLQWGEAVLDRLEGMFAFALWDRQRQRLLAARDPAGIKPLYWSARGNTLWFASEIKAILADPVVERALDQRGLAHYLAYGHGVAPATAFRGIHKLPPGHLLIAEDGQARTVRYWELRPQSGAHRDPERLAQETLQRLTAAVRSHMVADVPVGAFLSGGLDSSGVVGLMCREAGAPVQTFSAGFAEPGFDESSEARRVADHFGTVHRALPVGPREFAGALPAIVWHYDEPFADAASVPLFLLAQEAARHVKVVLTGEGSDELFAGYRRISVERFASLYGLLPASCRRWLAGAASQLPRLRRVKQALSALALDDPAERYASWLTVFDSGLRTHLLSDANTAALDVLEPYRTHIQPALDPVTRALCCDFKTWLPDAYLEKVDKATMAFSLEARVPFLDRQLVDFAFTLPPQLKIRGLDTKHILKRALSRVLPQETIRRKKRGFAVPLDPWFRGPLRELIQSILTDRRTRERGLLRADALQQLAQEHWSGAHVRHAHLYQVLMLELWCRTYLDGQPAPVAL